MKYSRINPPKPLSWIVHFFWVFEGDFSASNPYDQTISASVYPKLAFQYGEGMFLTNNGKVNQLFRSGIQSQSSIYGQISTQQKIGVFGVYFHPYALSILFNIPASTLTNLNVEIYDLLGDEGKLLEEQIISSINTTQRIEIISKYVENRLRYTTLEDRKLIAAVQSIVSQRGIVNIPKLSESYFMSQRHFERKFKTLTGFSPKSFSKIVRFEECIYKATTENSSLSELTYEFGYYDQSHMIKDFKDFSGCSPRSLLSEDISIFFE